MRSAGGSFCDKCRCPLPAGSTYNKMPLCPKHIEEVKKYRAEHRDERRQAAGKAAR